MMRVMSSQEALQKRLASLEFRKTGLMVALTGAPGIGKSFTTRAVLAGLGLRSLHLQANMDGVRQAQAWLDVLGVQIRHLPDWVQAGLRRWQSGDPLEIENVAQMLAVCVKSQAPFVVLLEDWHTASPAQVNDWEVVVRAMQGLAGVGLVITSRNVLPTGCESMPLEPLSKTQALALLEREASPLPGAMLDWIWQRSLGNPLFLLEYFRDLRQRGNFWFDGGLWQWREPAANQRPLTLEALIERVLDRITQAGAKRLLFALAVLGQRSDPNFWEAVTGLATNHLSAAQQELERLGVLNNLEFSHPLYLEMTLAHSRLEDRQEIVVKACGWLEESDPIRAAELSVLAGFDAERILGFHLRAIVQLKADPTRVALCKARACEFAQGEMRLQLALEAARVLIQADLKSVLPLTAFILELQPLHLEALGLRGRVLARLGDVNQALQNLEQIATTSRDREWWRWKALILLETHDFTGVHQIVLEHPELQLELDGEIAVGVFESVYAQEGDSASALVLERALGRNLEPSAKTRLLIAQAGLLVNSEQFEKAELVLQEMLQTQQDVLPKRTLALVERILGFAAHGLQRYEQAAQIYTNASKLALEVGDQRRYLDIQHALGGLYFDQANFAAAEKALLEVWSLASNSPANTYLVQTECWLSELYTCWSPPHGGALSLKYAHAALRLAQQFTDDDVLFQALYHVTCAEAAHGDPNVAMQHLEHMMALHVDADTEFMLHSAHGLTLAALGRKPEAIAAYERSANLLVDKPNLVVNAAQNGLELDLLRNDLASARQHLNIFREHDFGPGIVTAQRYFPQLREDHLEVAPVNSLRLEVLGSIQLSQDGEAIVLRGAKRKLLVALLLEAHLAGQAEVRSADLGEALYPNANDDEANAAIRQLVFQLRAQIGTESVQTTINGYRLNGVQSDAQIFLETGNPDLWRGAYLADVPGMEGHELETVREALYSQLKRRAEALLSVEPAQSARLARILMEAEPFDTNVLALALRALQAQGSYVSISRMYKKSRETWLEVGERLPERWTEFLDSLKVA
jgi:DNA-binding SARP family transcriptional activator